MSPVIAIIDTSLIQSFEAVCAILILVYVLCIIAVIGPACSFLVHGWFARRSDLLSGFSEQASAAYLKAFRPSDAKTLATAAGGSAAKQMGLFYNFRFGRRLFLCPLFFLTLVTTSLLWLCLQAAFDWLSTKKMSESIIPPEMVLAILGACMWVVSDGIYRHRRNEFNPTELCWYGFRILFSVPLAFGISQLFAPSLALPIAFLLGTFPTTTVFTIARRAASKGLQLTDAPGTMQSELQVLPTVDTIVAERFADEGITNIHRLAYSDPVSLAIQTGLPFNFIIGCSSQALMQVYLRTSVDQPGGSGTQKTAADIARRYGLDSAFEWRSLWENLHQGDDERKAQAAAIVAALATNLNLPTAAVMNIMEEIALDPITEFHALCWNS